MRGRKKKTAPRGGFFAIDTLSILYTFFTVLSTVRKGAIFGIIKLFLTFPSYEARYIEEGG